jgi:sugar lactone lactonase YvrE
VFVANQTQFNPFLGSVNYYPEGASGNVAPTGEIVGSNTQLTQVGGVVVAQNGVIYVADNDTNMIVGFPPNSNGDVAPSIVIAGANTGLASPFGLAIDGAGDLYVANCAANCYPGPQPSVEEFAASSNGNVSPLRVISGSRTQLGETEGIAVDKRGYIYVSNADEGEVTVFRPHANGNVSPVRTISGHASEVDQPDGIAVDDRSLYVANWGNGLITRFNKDSGGDVRPEGVLHVAWQPNPSNPQALGGLAITPGGSIYAAGTNVPLLAEYRARAHGKKPPFSVISGSNTAFFYPSQVFVAIQP